VVFLAAVLGCNISCTATPTTTRVTVRSIVSLRIQTLTDITPVIHMVALSAVEVCYRLG